jgi:FtsP/CotA-like multicopper oxidase with cupredoxin domain
VKSTFTIDNDLQSFPVLFLTSLSFISRRVSLFTLLVAMRSFITAASSGLALLFAVSVSAKPLSFNAPLFERALSGVNSNSADDRSTWFDFDLSTNYYDTVPDTGDTVVYYLEITNTTASLDGVEREVQLVNGTFPGPTIIANWGDTVTIHVTNNLGVVNGSSIHWHGIRQNYTNQNDGVASITQCPNAPGTTETYTWRATQYGSSWYHSHWALQAWNGVLGGIIINGPASANYDVDAGNLFLNDWTHQTADQVYLLAEKNGVPTLDNGLINGTNVYNTLGSRFEMTWVTGTKYLLRLVNGAVETHYKFMVDNHTMTVTAADFVPVEPYVADFINIGMGQRYDVIIEANQTTADYWLRAIPQVACSDNDSADNIKGIIRYDSASTSDPTTSGYTYTDACDDETSNLVPVLSLDASSEDSGDDFAVTVTRSNNLFKWRMAGTSFVSDWADPTLKKVIEGNDTFSTEEHVIELDTANEWVYFVISTTQGVPHPIHLHGHDFYVLAQGTGTYTDGTTALTTTNPPRRDTAMLPASGYLVIAFLTDNPGTWLMHCHIGWHAAEGFSIQLLERINEIPALTSSETMNTTCNAWDSFVTSSSIEQEDSGI